MRYRDGYHIHFPRPVVRPISMEALAGLREILAGVSLSASRVAPHLTAAAMKSRLIFARSIEDGPTRHRAVKQARDNLRRARKRVAALYR